MRLKSSTGRCPVCDRGSGLPNICPFPKRDESEPDMEAQLTVRIRYN